MRFIGSKSGLIPEIESFVEQHVDGDEETFLDLFAGTNVVGGHFKERYRVISNDLLYFSFITGRAIIENNGGLSFEGLRIIEAQQPFSYLRAQAELYLKTNIVGYYERHYSPTGGAKYLSVENSKRIDFIRGEITNWRVAGMISNLEYAYLLASLINAIPRVSNTTGTYGAFLKHWDKRALKPLQLVPLTVIDNGRNNMSFNVDANRLVRRIAADITYIDTPYNNRQYASNYHLLENVARHGLPPLRGKTRLFDWSKLRSEYAMKNHALTAMSDLIKNVNSTHLILSYNNEGIIPEDDLLALLREHSVDNSVSLKRIPYRKYISKRPPKDDSVQELLMHVRLRPAQRASNGRTLSKKNFPSHEWKAEEPAYVKSPLNYIGGKFKLLPQIVPKFPRNIHTFVDLFSGGANVGVNVRADSHIFNDMNSKINEMFRFFSTQSPDQLIDKIGARIQEYGLSKTNEDGFLRFRKDYNNNPNPLDLYVLVSYSYNYQIRFNNSMEFNNPFGRNRSQFSKNMEFNLRSFVNRLQGLNAQFTDLFFTEFDFRTLNENDFVYLDPPYLITTGNYNDGNRGFLNWSTEQELKMYALLTSLSERGIRYALSNVLNHKGKTNVLLKQFIKTVPVLVSEIDHHYNHSSYNTKGSGSREVLITNYDVVTFDLI